MKITKQLKSKTQWFNISVAAVGIIEVNLHLMRDNLGDNYGFAFIAVSVVAMVLRNLTKEPIDAK